MYLFPLAYAAKLTIIVCRQLLPTADHKQRMRVPTSSASFCVRLSLSIYRLVANNGSTYLCGG